MAENELDTTNNSLLTTETCPFGKWKKRLGKGNQQTQICEVYLETER